MPLALICLCDGKLPQQGDWNRVRPVALRRFWHHRSLNKGCTQRHVTNNAAFIRCAQHVDARRAIVVVGPPVSLKPSIHGVAATVKTTPVVFLSQRPWWQNVQEPYSAQVSFLLASSCNPGFALGGAATQASNASQAAAGITTLPRSKSSNSAASSARRRTKSLRFVRACSEAASRSARSSAETRTLRIDLKRSSSKAVFLLIGMTIAYNL